MKSMTLRLGLFGPMAKFMESETGIDSHLCCNYNDTKSTDFLEDTECVPYSDENYKGFFQDNRIGTAFTVVFPVLCDFPDYSFHIPRPSSTSRYQCCKSGTPMPPYVQDSTFNINVYSSIFLFAISGIISLIVVVSLMIPFAKSIKKPNNKDEAITRWSTSSSRRQQRRQSVRMGESGFSTYNVYLIYIAFLDLIWCLYGIVVRVLYINQVLVPNTPTTSIALSVAYFAGNFWLNAFILLEVFLLLKASKNAKRTTPPSTRSLLVQGGAVFTFVVAYGLVLGLYFIPKANMWVFAGVNVLVTFPPIIYVSGLPVWIWWYGYLPPSSNIRASAMTSSGAKDMRDKAERDLALYFFRVVFVFVILYMPLSIFMFMARPWRSWPGYVNECILGIQPTVTFVFLLRKSDVKKHILDLVTLKVFFGNSSGYQSVVRGDNEIRTRKSSTEELLARNKIKWAAQEDQRPRGRDDGSKEGLDQSLPSEFLVRNETAQENQCPHRRDDDPEEP